MKKPYIFPKFIEARYFDPFDGTELASSLMHYQKRLSARGFYSHQIRRMTEGLKSIQSKILEGRTPAVRVRFIT